LKNISAGLLGFLVFILVAVPTMQAMADDAANEALAKRFYTEFNAGNIDAFDQFIAANVVDHSAAPGTPSGIDSLKKEMKDFKAAFPDIEIDNQKVLVSGAYVTVVSEASGTNTGPMMGMAATGKPAKFQTIDVWLVRDGKLAEAWHVEQLLQMMTQLGAMGK
jgi:predicted ester cyclase